MSDTAELPTIHANPGRFSTGTASAMGKRSVEARKIKAAAEKQRIHAIEVENAIAKPIVEALRVVASADVLPTVQASSAYVLQRLARVRAQIDALDEQLFASTDPRAIQAISVAIRNLCEIERVLAGRPGPGNRQPSKERAAPASTTAEPL